MLRHILLSVGLLALQGCQKLSYKPSEVPVQFTGVKSVFETKAGTYVVNWDEPENAKDLVDSYEIFIADLNGTSSAKLAEDPPQSTGTSSGSSVGMIVEMSEEKMPATVGKVLAVVRGANNYTISGLESGSYGLQVKAVGKNGTRDTNQLVALVSVVLTVQFNGVDQATYENGNITLSWQPYQTSIKGEPIHYVVYEGARFADSDRIAYVTADPNTGVVPNSFTVSMRDKAPGAQVTYGVRVKDPLGRYDSNVNTITVMLPSGIPEDVCLEARPISTRSILIKFKFPEDADTVSIRQNGRLIATIADPTREEFEDIDLRQGTKYDYTCEATRFGRIIRGASIFSATTRTSDPPTFGGINSASRDNASGKVTLSWNDATNVPVAYYAVFASPGPVVQWAHGPTVQIKPSELTTAPNSLTEVSAILDTLGDDFTHSIGVRACSVANICDSNDKSATIVVGDLGAPKSIGVTNVELIQVSAQGPKFAVTAPWKPSDGYVATRKIYFHRAKLALNQTKLPACAVPLTEKLYYLEDVKTYTRCQQSGGGDWSWQPHVPPTAPAGPSDAAFGMFPVRVSDADKFNPPNQLELTGILENSMYTIVVRDADGWGNESTNTKFIRIVTPDFAPPVFDGVSKLEIGPQAHILRDGQSADWRNSSLIAKFQAPDEGEAVSHYQVYLREVTGANANISCPAESSVVNTSQEAVQQGSLYGEISVTEINSDNYTDSQKVRFVKVTESQPVLHIPGQEAAVLISGLRESTSYVVCLRARDAIGNVSATSAALRKSTIDTTPPVFDGVSSISYDKEKEALRVQWPASPSSDLLNYKIDIWAFDLAVADNSDPQPSYPSSPLEPRTHTTVLAYPPSSSAFITKAQVENLKSNHKIFVIMSACDTGGMIAGGQENCRSFELESSKSITLDDVEAPLFDGTILGVDQVRTSRSEVSVKVKFSKPKPNILSCSDGQRIAGAVNGTCLNRITQKCFLFQSGSVTGSEVDCPIWADVKGFSIYNVVGDSDSYQLFPLKDCLLSRGDVDQDQADYASCTVTGLEPYRDFLLHVRAFDNQSPANITVLDPSASSLAITTVDEDPPEFSAGLALSFDQQQMGIKVGWARATDNQYPDNPKSKISYQIYKKVGNVTDWTKTPSENSMIQIATVTPTLEGNASLEYLDQEGIAGGETYSYAICAVDATFQENQSDSNRKCDAGKSYTVQDTTPPVITEVKFFKHGTSEIKTQADKAWDIEVSVSDNRSHAGFLTAEICVLPSLITQGSQHIDESCPQAGSENVVADSTNPDDDGFKTGKAKFIGSAGDGLGGPANADMLINYRIRVKEPLDSGGFLTVSEMYFTESYNKLTVTSVKSSEGRTTGGDLMLIKGSGFSSLLAVKIGQKDCVATTVLSSEILHCKSPAVTNASTLEVSAQVSHPNQTGALVTSSSSSSGAGPVSFNYCDAGSCQNVCNKPSEWTPGGLFASGDGRSTNPWIICSSTHLRNIRSAGLLSGNLPPSFKLGANVDMTGITMEPIANLPGATSTNWAWRYSRLYFNGDDYAVANYSFISPPIPSPCSGCDFGSHNKLGLFGIVNEGEISNLAVINVLIKGITNNGEVGGLAGYIQDRVVIKNILVNGKVTGGHYTGGVVGYATRGIIGNLQASGVEVGDQSALGGHTGGLLGAAANASSFSMANEQGQLMPSRLSASGVIRGYGNTGGLFGVISNSGGELDGPIFSGSISLASDWGGGIAGRIDMDASTMLEIKNPEVSATIRGRHQLGGVAGGSGAGVGFFTISGAKTLVDVSGTNNVGGVVGAVSGGAKYDITNSVSRGKVAGFYQVGGLAGALHGNCARYYTTGDAGNENNITASAADSQSEALVQSTGSSGQNSTMIGGAFGFMLCAKASNVDVYGAVTVSRQNTASHGAYDIGGFTGRLDSAVVKDSSVQGRVTVSSLVDAQAIGGFFGSLYQGWSMISNSRALGDVDSGPTGRFVGGFGGRSRLGFKEGNPEPSKIINSRSAGNVSSLRNEAVHMGGFIGLVENGIYGKGNIPQAACPNSVEIRNPPFNPSDTSVGYIPYWSAFNGIQTGRGCSTWGTYERNRAAGAVTASRGSHAGGFIGTIVSHHDEGCTWDRSSWPWTFHSCFAGDDPLKRGPRDELLITKNSAGGKVTAGRGSAGGFVAVIDGATVTGPGQVWDPDCVTNHPGNYLKQFICTTGWWDQKLVTYGHLPPGTTSESIQNRTTTQRDNNNNVDLGVIMAAKNFKITQNFSTGDVSSSSSKVGGFIGEYSFWTDNGFGQFADRTTSCDPNRQYWWQCGVLKRDNIVIADNYSRGNVQGTGTAGGFAGIVPNVVERAYSTGTVYGSPKGGFHGTATTNGVTANGWLSSLQNVFWDKTVAGNLTGMRWGSGQTTPDMKKQGTFTNFDFSAIWTMPSGDYPIFIWQEEAQSN
jgi:hypothetical protein